MTWKGHQDLCGVIRVIATDSCCEVVHHLKEVQRDRDFIGDIEHRHGLYRRQNRLGGVAESSRDKRSPV